jgi:hypothetical protein
MADHDGDMEPSDLHPQFWIDLINEAKAAGGEFRVRIDLLYDAADALLEIAELIGGERLSEEVAGIDADGDIIVSQEIKDKIERIRHKKK